MRTSDDTLRPTRLEAERDEHDRPSVRLPDPYRCDDPWCPSAGQGAHLHGTRPDGMRV